METNIKMIKPRLLDSLLKVAVRNITTTIILEVIHPENQIDKMTLS